jgi:hypothetical protein
MAEQACLDAAGALEELDELITLLRGPDQHLDDRTCVQRLLDYGPAGSGVVGGGELGGMALDGGAGLLPGLPGGLHARRKLARHYLALAASQLDSLLGTCRVKLRNWMRLVWLL